MPVATVPAYDEMWADPQVVAALSGDTFTYSPAEPWNEDALYHRCDQVLAGDCAYGGCVYTAIVDPPVGIEPTGNPTVWALDEAATIERLRLNTATLQATWLLDALSGFRLHGEECWVEDYRVTTCTIKLRRSPVHAVTSVTRIHRCNQPGGDIVDWCHDTMNTISLCCGPGQPTQFYPGYISWADYPYSGYPCGCGDHVQITYLIGSNLPPGTESLVAWLATEYNKAATGQACSLPERITNITRQGVSWTVLDPQDFLDKGFSGISRVDNWLAPLKAMLGGQIIDPLTSTRLFSQRVDCPVINPL